MYDMHDMEYGGMVQYVYYVVEGRLLVFMFCVYMQW